MNREIKFRAWDKEEKKMHYSDSKLDYGMWFSLDSGKTECLQNCAYTDTFGDEHDDWQPLDNIMECVGLPSIKGEDIYEGDIVRRRSYTDYDAYANVSEIRGVVEFRDYAWCIVQRTEDEKDYVTPLFMEAEFGLIREIEILGNIYENPELASTVGVVGYAEEGALLPAT